MNIEIMLRIIIQLQPHTKYQPNTHVPPPLMTVSVYSEHP